MATSILNDIKKLLGIAPDYDAFDQDLVIHINSVISTLDQIGASPSKELVISGSSETWDQLLEGRRFLETLKSYIYFKVRLAFDPPATSFAISAVEKQIEQCEWRISVYNDSDENVSQTLGTDVAPIVATLQLNTLEQYVGFTQQLLAYGNPSSFRWSVESGEIPDGLQLSALGFLYGTPQVSGAYEFTLRCSNNVGPDALIEYSGDIVSNEEVVVTHSIFGIVEPIAQDLTVYNDGGDGLWTGNQFYLRNDPAYAGVTVVGMRLYLPIGSPAALKASAGQVGVAVRDLENDFWNGSTDGDVLPAMSLTDLPGGVLQDGWNDIMFDEPVVLGMLQGVIVGIKWNVGGYYLYASNNWSDPVVVQANDGYGLFLAEHNQQGGTSTPVRGWNTVNDGTWSAAWYGIDIIVQEG